MSFESVVANFVSAVTQKAMESGNVVYHNGGGCAQAGAEKTVELDGRIIKSVDGKIFVDGREVDGGNRRVAKKEVDFDDEQERAELESRFPHVTWQGNCKKIQIGNDVTFGDGVRIQQLGKHSIVIDGKTVVGDNVLIMNSLSSGGGSTVSSTFHGGALVRVQSHSQGSGAGILKISSSTLYGENRIEGSQLRLADVSIAHKVQVTARRGGSIDLSDSLIRNHLKVEGSGDLEIEESIIESPVTLAGSGDIEISNSIIRAGITLAGSGDIKVSNKSKVNASLLLAGSGDIRVKSSEVNRPENLVGSYDIHYLRGERSVL